MTVAWTRCFKAAARALSFAIAALVLCVGTAHAHKSSDAYLQFSRSPDGAGLLLRWDIALRDLEVAVPIDQNNDGMLRWGEIRAAFPAIDAYAMSRLRLPAGCNPIVKGHALERRSDGAYAVLNITATCPLIRNMPIGYSLFSDVDPTHRGIATIDFGDGAPKVLLLDPTVKNASAGAQTSDGGKESAADSRSHSFLLEGLRHIVTGYDHVLFLLCLLLPAVLRRQDGRWKPVDSARQALGPVLGVVTLFTLAHSITLVLAALDIVSLSPRLIEPAIAGTIIIAAADNLRPVFGRFRYLITFIFGMVHGFGFAGALKEVSLPPIEFAWALLKFNLGIEGGQLVIVVIAVPLLFMLRRWKGYPRWILQAGSTAAVILAGAWFLERVFDMVILPFKV